MNRNRQQQTVSNVNGETQSTARTYSKSSVVHSAKTVTQEPGLRFLCSHHRDWVYFNSQKALEDLDQIQIKGEILLEHQRWAQALPHLGSAWEISDILLQLFSGEKTFLVNKLCCLCVMLSRCMLKMGQADKATKLYQQTRQSLETLVQQQPSDTEEYAYLMLCIQQINTRLKTPDTNPYFFIPGSLQAVQVLH